MRVWSVFYRTASPPDAINRMQVSGLTIYDVKQIDLYSIQFQIYPADIPILSAMADKYGDEIEHVTKSRRLSYKQLLQHPILIAGVLLIFLLTVFLPTRILFIQVEGNHQVSSAQILQVLNEHGVGFGVIRKNIKSGDLKTVLLSEIPTLQWAGINTTGCVATITVRERTESDPDIKSEGINSIVAVIDGIIHEVTVSKGHGLCKPGDAVKADQILISAYEDLGICIRATQAEGEVFAYTTRRFSAVTPAKRLQKSKVQQTQTKYYLVIGKKRINFYNNSGILDTTCAKIYEQRYVTLPGGFTLPVIIGKETYISYSADECTSEDMTALLSTFAASSLEQQMVAGSILHASEAYTQDEEVYRINGIYGCHEMIGRLRKEECLP